jgi:hypothetical protein
MKKKTNKFIFIILLLFTSCVSKRYIHNRHTKDSLLSWHGKDKMKYHKSSLTNYGKKSIQIKVYKKRLFR